MNAADAARVCHEANRALQIVLGEEPSPPWDDAPEWQRSSAVEGVIAAAKGASPEQLHESWCDVKWRGGWTYGPVKDADATPPTHPCLVPYMALGPEQRLKDALFHSVVRSLLGFLSPAIAL